MKLVVQIPCYNEEHTLEETVRCIPRSVDGFAEVEILLVDDGSTDNTCAVAKAAGVDHVLVLGSHVGLAKAFMAGLQAAVRLGADVVVNTDADNQYCGDDVRSLVKPVVQGEADIVIGERPIEQMRHFSWVKRRLQRLGSWVVRYASGTRVRDAASGFRAMSRETALRLNVVSLYSYTLETIIQAGRTGMRVVSVPVRTNPPTRESRLVRNTLSYVLRSLTTVLRITVLYRPFRFFAVLASFFGLFGLLLAARSSIMLVFYGEPHIQTLVVAAGSVVIAFMVFLIGLAADLLSVNRSLLEELQYYARLERATSIETRLESHAQDRLGHSPVSGEKSGT